MAELNTVARPYAEAIFRLAKEQGTLAQWSETLARLDQVAQDQKVRDIVADPQHSAAQVQQILLQLVDANGEEVRNFITLVLENRRFTVLPAVREQYELLKAAEEGRVGVTLESAFPLTDTQANELLQAVARHFHQNVTAKVVVSPELIGGVKVTVGDQVIDASIAGKLSELATSLKS